MKLFVDEDTGAGLGRALREVDVDANHIGLRSLPPGTADERWMRVASQQGRMVLSRNVSILVTDAQIELLISERLGFLFLPPWLKSRELLLLVLRNWAKLEALYEHQHRPFGFYLSTNGRLTQLPLDATKAALRRRLRRLRGLRALFPPATRKHPVPTLSRARGTHRQLQPPLPLIG